MRLIFLFRRLVFAQVLLGIIAFCMAEQNPGMLLIAGAIAALSWYVTEGPTGRPLPKWVINIASIFAVAWLALDLYLNRGNIIIAMGHFTIWLQVIMLYADKGSREYGQVLVLSMLQMVGASVLSVSMVYGALLAAYCLLSIFTLLVFHLKTTSDSVWDMMKRGAPDHDPPPRPKAVGGRGQRWQFRTMAIVVGGICAGIGAAVFVVMPRTGTSKFTNELLGNVARVSPGFSDRVDLDTSPGSGDNREAVINLRLTQGGRSQVSQDATWLLRGAALDVYDARTHAWARSQGAAGGDLALSLTDQDITLARLPDDTPMIEAEITVRSAGSSHLFTLQPLVQLTSPSLENITFSPIDQTLRTTRQRAGPTTYTARSPIQTPPDLQSQYEQTLQVSTPQVLPGRRGQAVAYASGWQIGKRPVRALARQVLTEAGLPLDTDDAFQPAAAVQALADHLAREYDYTLDQPAPVQYAEPLLEFLLVSKQGHCELFASGHAALVRSLGIPARVVTGYLASEVNTIGDYYIVRQNHAHAWTEVQLPGRGWITFDPTPPAEVQRIHHGSRGWFHSLTNLFDYFEYLWISSVVAYDAKSQSELIGSVEVTLSETANDPDGLIAAAVDWVKQLPRLWRFDKISLSLIAIILVFIAIGLASLIRTLVVRRRRMIALQLGALPRRKRRGLARRLRFYLNMLELLERHGYHRPEWQSPFGFAQELAGADPLRFDPVVALTELFYEIRFGHREMNTDRRDRVKAHLKRLEQSLSGKGEA